MSRWPAFILMLLWSTSLMAGVYDIDANQFFIISGNKLVADGDNFERVMAEMGVATGPKMLGPAKTLGILGFDVGYTVGLTNINESSVYWKKATTEATNFVPTMQINLSKGLPFSFQLEGLINHVFKSEIWGVGMNLKWAAIEGFRYFPEVSFSSNIGTLMGTTNYTLLTFGGAALVSKTFGIGGVLSVAPYGGYHALGGRGASEVLYHFVGNDPKTFVINPFFFIRHMGVAGVTVKGGIVAFGFESMFTDGMQVFSFKGSLNF